MNKFKIFFHTCILLFGFLNGLWIFIGVNPETIVANAFLQTIISILPAYSGLFNFGFALYGLFSTISSIFLTYAMGGWLGIISVFLAFLGGIFITTIGIYLLIFSIICGLIAVLTKSDD
jgi:hypothetical protein